MCKSAFSAVGELPQTPWLDFCGGKSGEGEGNKEGWKEIKGSGWIGGGKDWCHRTECCFLAFEGRWTPLATYF